MKHSLYNPFERFDIAGKKCFLSGEPVDSGNDLLTVFPGWLMEEFKLNDQPFKMLDESYTTYGELKVPCSAEVRSAISKLQDEIETAFRKGHEEVSRLDELKLFQWSGLIVYGLIYREIIKGLNTKSTDEPFHIAPALIHKFRNLNFFLQSVFRNIEFEDFKPYSLFLFHVNPSKTEEPFEHRNEINTMTFSFRMNDTGLLICLQDNGLNKLYHEQAEALIKNKLIHPVQYKEFCARVFYSSYLFNKIPEYDIIEHDRQVYISLGGSAAGTVKSMFDEWVPKTYGQILEALWKPWNIHLMEILKDPENPLSFLAEDADQIHI